MLNDTSKQGHILFHIFFSLTDIKGLWCPSESRVSPAPSQSFTTLPCLSRLWLSRPSRLSGGVTGFTLWLTLKEEKDLLLIICFERLRTKKSFKVSYILERFRRFDGNHWLLGKERQFRIRPIRSSRIFLIWLFLFFTAFFEDERTFSTFSFFRDFGGSGGSGVSGLLLLGQKSSRQARTSDLQTSELQWQSPGLTAR